MIYHILGITICGDFFEFLWLSTRWITLSFTVINNFDIQIKNNNILKNVLNDYNNIKRNDIDNIINDININNQFRNVINIINQIEKEKINYLNNDNNNSDNNNSDSESDINTIIDIWNNKN